MLVSQNVWSMVARRPPIEYARSGDLFIAYQVFGEGPFDLVMTLPWMSHLEITWEWPPNAQFYEDLGSVCRVILYDRRGMGLSDQLSLQASFEDSMDDITAVLDAVGSERAALFGTAEGGPLCMLFAATYPERTSALTLFATYPRMSYAPDYPWGVPAERHERILRAYEEGWGRRPVGIRTMSPSLADNERYREWFLRAQRNSVSPGAAMAWHRVLADADTRHVLPTIRVPTLVLHRRQDPIIPIEVARYTASQIPGAKLVELQGSDHSWYGTGSESIIPEVLEFLTGSRRVTQPDRVLATVLFTDIVGSTERAAAVGDHAWRRELDRYYELARKESDRFRGRVVKTLGDGVVATFDGPGRAINCACAIGDSVRLLGLEVRTGLHTGEIELQGDDIAGVAVHIGARVLALADPGEVVVSGAIPPLVAGSGIEFEDRGEHVLKGVPGVWRLYAVQT